MVRLHDEPGFPRQRLARPTPLVRAAAGTGLATCLGALALFSPALQVREVVWAGSLRPEPAHRLGLEAAAHGKPLLLSRDAALRELLQFTPGQVRIDFARHLPGTLQVTVTPIIAAMVLDDGVLLDRQGQVLDASLAVPGLPCLRGFVLDAKRQRLEPEAARQCAALLAGMTRAGLAIAAAERRGDDLVVTLQQSRVEVRFAADDLDTGLRKLSMLLCRFEPADLPARVDLRFRDQIVLESGEARRGRG